MLPTATIPTATRIGYSVAETGINAVETLLRLYLLIFYTDAVGLAPGWAGLAVALGLCWDAVTDPLMGYLSDRWYSRLGGRRPFLLLGGLLLAISVYLLFSPPFLPSPSCVTNENRSARAFAQITTQHWSRLTPCQEHQRHVNCGSRFRHHGRTNPGTNKGWNMLLSLVTHSA